MYRIKFPSGEEATIESPEGLTEAVLNGTVTSYCFVLHERSGQWLPIVRHPHYHQALTARASGDAAPAAAPILPEPLQPSAPPQASARPEATRTTAAPLEVPPLDDLLEMLETEAATEPPAPTAPKAAAPTPAPAAAKPRGRSRDLEFLYVPESRPAPAPSSTPRTAGPPPRPGAVIRPSAPAPAASAPAASTPAAVAPAAPAPSAPAPAPARATAPSASAPTIQPAAPSAPAPKPVEHVASLPWEQPSLTPPVIREIEPVAEAEEQREPVATATMAPVAPRRVTRFEDGFVDPVEAALSFDAPAPIELDEPRRPYAPARTKFMMVAAGLVFAAGAGLLAWSPWSGGPAEAVAASQPRTSAAAPSAQPTTLADVDMSSPAEEDPAPSVYDVPADADLASRTSFGGTAAPGDRIATVPADPGILPSAPKTNRVAVPVVGVMDPRDSALEQVKRAALVTPDSLR